MWFLKMTPFFFVGEEVLLDEAGKIHWLWVCFIMTDVKNLKGRDATESFEDIGHSDEAREILEKYLVGELNGTVSKGLIKK